MILVQMKKIKPIHFECDVRFWDVQKARDSLNLIQGEVELGMRPSVKNFQYEETFLIVYTRFSITIAAEDSTIAEELKQKVILILNS